MKLFFLGTLFVLLSGIAQAATNMVLAPAGYIPAGTTLNLAENSMNYFSTLQANAANQMEIVQKQMLQTQFQNGLVSVAQSSFADFQRERKKGKRTMTVKTTEPIPYYTYKSHYTDDATPVEKTAVPPTAAEAIDLIQPVQKALDKSSGIQGAKDCDLQTIKDTPTYSSWDEYIKNIQITAMSAQPPVNPQAVKKTVDFLKANRARLEKTVRNRNYAVITDYTQPSTKERMLVLNLKTQKVERYLVSHGIGKGYPDSALPPAFSKKDESYLTPPGFLVMKNEVPSPTWGKKIVMEGLESRNSNSKDRDIVFHGGPVNRNEILDSGMLGFSRGCLQVPRPDYAALRRRLQDGVLAYNFTPEDNK